MRMSEIGSTCRVYEILIRRSAVLQLEEYIGRYGSIRYQTAQRVRRGESAAATDVCRPQPGPQDAEGYC